MQADPGFSQMTLRLLSVPQSECDKLLSNFGFKFNLRHYSKETRRAAAAVAAAVAAADAAADADFAANGGPVHVDPGFSQRS